VHKFLKDGVEDIFIDLESLTQSKSKSKSKVKVVKKVTKLTEEETSELYNLL